MSSAPQPARPSFADDPRVYFSRDSGTWRIEQDDGTELEYDTSKSAWVPVLDDDLVKRHQAAYSVAGVDEETPAAPVLARENKKRKQPEDYTAATDPTVGHSIKRGRTDKTASNSKQPVERKSKNTAVYVTGLPVDATMDEIVDRFSKFGVLEEDDDGDSKVKMYAKDDGSFSGEALVVYFKEDSVTLAVSLLDEAELRIGDPTSVMSVVKADFSHKGSSGSTHTTGEHKPRRTVDKKKISKRIGKMQRKIDEWNDEDGFGPSMQPEDNTNTVNKNSRVVVLKHMFSLQDIEEDATLLLDLKEDVREECENLGEVTNVVLYDQEPDGIMTVKFRDPISAQACVIKMNGRFFDGRTVEATLYSGRERFKRSGAGDSAAGDGDADEKKRLDNFAQWLLAEGD
ncbi:hypothetical protein DL96DRAFT_1669516 [Flagelloscypha sp. PMI_526]|nr:hypothetical protein DL96DRAFT_1669516 [Flagelloscypha sp. PMI_526]